MARLHSSLAAAALLLLSSTSLIARDEACRDMSSSDLKIYEHFWSTVTPELASNCILAGTDANHINLWGLSALSGAIEFSKNPDVVKTLLSRGADANLKGLSQGTHLHQATSHNPFNEETYVITLLLAAGANVHARDESGFTPLYWAGLKSNPAVLKVLLKAGADVNARNERGITPLHWATEFNENPKVFQELLNAGANVHARDEDGDTPIHWASSDNDNREVIRMLLEAGAKVDPVNADGDTPLHLAARNNEYSDVIMLLLKAGANSTVTNDTGETVFDLVKKNDALKGTESYWALHDAKFK